MPVDEAAPLGSEVEDDVPLDVEVCEAEPGDWLGVPALGRLPEPPDEEDDDEEVEPEEEEELDEVDPPADGMPPEEPLLEEVAHPATIRSTPTAPIATVRCSCAATSVVTRSMDIAPYLLMRVPGECGLAKLNGT